MIAIVEAYHHSLIESDGGVQWRHSPTTRAFVARELVEDRAYLTGEGWDE